MSETVDNLILDLLEWIGRAGAVHRDHGGMANLVPTPADLGRRHRPGLHDRDHEPGSAASSRCHRPGPST
jgi:hypothetical protein